MPTDKQLFVLIKKLIAEKLHKKRVGRGSIADFLGVSQGKVRAWEDGQRPSADDLELLVKLFNFSPKWLLTGKGETFLGEETKKMPKKDSKTVAVTDPIAQRLETATRLLKETGASPEVIQQAIMKILDLQNEPHTQAEANTLDAPAFADKCERGIKRT
ncbi:helix-turn-helix domain-containing protein [Halodesulfovibrio aestuarii]|uniref:Helix-turn-helix domain-containing protein n=1 Tax=Halodesulfovibrio aestuarii TaxID=126333 RepID=A0ABV4JUH2_9BACT